MITKKIALIGAGNLGYSIVQGLLSKQAIPAENLFLSDISEERISFLRKEGYQASNDNVYTVKKSDWIILAVKPWQFDTVVREIGQELVNSGKILISCITGISSETIHEVIGKKVTLVLAMPNTGMSVGESMTALVPVNLRKDEILAVNELFSFLGRVEIIEEKMLPAATALGGCGIGFALRFIRAAMEAGVEIGFNAHQARTMAAQIAKGAAELVLNSGNHPEVEIDKVTTPGGITITGLNELEHNGFSSSIIKGIMSSFKKVSE
ncbi:pyrroline-5-carboxylate reductase [Bacteroidota bacterium]